MCFKNKFKSFNFLGVRKCGKIIFYFRKLIFYLRTLSTSSSFFTTAFDPPIATSSGFSKAPLRFLWKAVKRDIKITFMSKNPKFKKVHEKGVKFENLIFRTSPSDVNSQNGVIWAVWSFTLHRGIIHCNHNSQTST